MNNQTKLNPAVTAASSVSVLWLLSPLIALVVGIPLFIAVVAFGGAFMAAWPLTVPLTIYGAFRGIQKFVGAC